MKYLLVVLAFLGWGIVPTLAQPSPDPVPTSITTTIEQVVPTMQSNRVLDVLSGSWMPYEGDALMQDGMRGSQVYITQWGNDNATFLQQYGAQNAASIQLEGNDNVVDAAQWYGNNVLGLVIQGSGNTIPVRQYNVLGRGNDLSLELLGVDGLNLPVPITQIGGGIPVHVQIRRGTP